MFYDYLSFHSGEGQAPFLFSDDAFIASEKAFVAINEILAELPATLAKYKHPTSAHFIKGVVQGGVAFIQKDAERRVRDFYGSGILYQAAVDDLVKLNISKIPEGLKAEVTEHYAGIHTFLRDMAAQPDESDWEFADGAAKLADTALERCRAACTTVVPEAVMKEAEAVKKLVKEVSKFKDRYNLFGYTFVNPANGQTQKAAGLLDYLLNEGLTEERLIKSIYNFSKSK